MKHLYERSLILEPLTVKKVKKNGENRSEIELNFS